jgi:ATP synthase protein I
LSDQSDQSTLKTEEETIEESNSSLEPKNSMEEYYQLQQNLLLVTVISIGIIVVPVWFFFSLNTALNYLLGAVTGVAYLGLLGRDVERLGQQQGRLGAKGLAVFAVLIIVTTRWQELHIMPVFLGFLTYKISIIFYTLKLNLNSANR